MVRRFSVGVVFVAGSRCRPPTESEKNMRAFPVRLPSGQRYWTVLDEDLRVVVVADDFLRHQRFGRDGAESTTKAYAHAIALFLRWCARTGRDWQAGVERFGLFMTWLAHAGPQASGAEAAGTGSAVVLAGPGAVAARSPSRINGVLTAVRGMVVHAVAAGHAPAGLVPVLYEVADDRDLPEQARGGDGRMAWRMRARHRLREPETAVDRASDEQIVAVLRACRSARDRLVVLLMARAGLRRGELCGLRRSDVHLLVDSRMLGCEVARSHVHVVRRDNPNGAWAKSRRQRVVPLDFLVVQAFDAYEFERMRVPAAAGSDLLLVNLFREPLGAPMRPDAIGELLAAASRRAGLDRPIRPHQLRHAAGSNLADAGAGIDVVAELLGHAAVSSSQVYVHPDPSRLRAAVDSVPSPRERAGANR
ncbi:MAG: tyrosine-type recombinase/integrase [Pseudonocardiaceae bacterium]